MLKKHFLYKLRSGTVRVHPEQYERNSRTTGDGLSFNALKLFPRFLLKIPDIHRDFAKHFISCETEYDLQKLAIKNRDQIFKCY